MSLRDALRENAHEELLAEIAAIKAQPNYREIVTPFGTIQIIQHPLFEDTPMNPLTRPTQPPRRKRKPQPKPKPQPQPAAPASPESHDLPGSVPIIRTSAKPPVNQTMHIPLDTILGSITYDDVIQPKEPPMPEKRLCFGLAVSPQFRVRVLEIAHNLGCDPSHLMACMAFETGGKFAPDIRNAAGSGAVGLIQFMSVTARDLGTTPAHLARMTAVQQLDYVEKYFRPYTGKVGTLGDLYMAILWPKAVGKPMDYALFRQGDGTKVYFQNKGLDANADGTITKQECCAKVEQWLERGMREGAAWTY